MINRRNDRHDAAIIVPDSGYASAEEGEGEEAPQDLDLDRIRADTSERDFAIKWVVGLIARSDVWMSTEEGDLEEETRLLDEAVELLDVLHRVGDESRDEGNMENGEEDGALVREFVFPLSPTPASRKPMGDTRREVHVQLNDLPVSQDDHTSVGLQSWGSCIILAEGICADPERFLKTSVVPPVSSDVERTHHIRILELGAGTGMLSVVCAKILRDWNWEGDIVATDYHADVLRNLDGNVRMNLLGKENVTVTVSHLDWKDPSSYDTKFDEGSFDIILAADVIYDPHHARWIKGVVKRLLVKPLPCDGGVCSGEMLGSGTFWLFIPVRTTGRHEGMIDTVRELFPSVRFGMGLSESTCLELVIVDSEEISRRDGIGRADEVGYQLYRIGWAPWV